MKLNYLNIWKKNWFNKPISYYSNYELFENSYLADANDHFYITNNIEEKLHSKLNLYLPNKKITRNNFISSLKKVIEYYETNRDNIQRKDYINKTLVKYAKTIKKIIMNGLNMNNLKN